MVENRLVVELFLEKPNFNEVSKFARTLESEGIKPIIMPPEDRGIAAHLIIEKSDLDKARDKLKQLGMIAAEKEVVIIRLENKPGTMASTTKKISDTGVNLTYAFSVAMTPTMSYVLFAASDNNTILKALEH